MNGAVHRVAFTRHEPVPPVIRATPVRDRGEGTLIRCPQPHPDFDDRLCNAPLVTVMLPGDITVQCYRCKRYLHIQGND